MTSRAMQDLRGDMKTAQLGTLFDADGTRNDVPGHQESGAGVHHGSSGQPKTRATPGSGFADAVRRVSPTVVAQIQSWLAAKAAGDQAAAASWQLLPAMLEEAIERGIACVELQTADRDDLRQKIWLRIVSHFEDLDSTAKVESVAAWAESIARREAVREWHRRKRRARRARTNEDAALDSIFQDLAIDADDPEHLKNLVRQIIGEMQASGHAMEAEILRLHYLESLSLQDVAATVSLTMSQMYRRHKRALQMFRVLIRNKDGSCHGA